MDDQTRLRVQSNWSFVRSMDRTIDQATKLQTLASNSIGFIWLLRRTAGSADVPCLFDTDLMWTLQSVQLEVVLLFGKSAVKDRKIIWINTYACTHTATIVPCPKCDENHLLLSLLRMLLVEHFNGCCFLAFFCCWNFVYFFPFVCIALHRLHNFIIWSCVLGALYLVKHMWIDNKYMQEDQITDLFFPYNRHLFDDSIRREMHNGVVRMVFKNVRL